MVSPTKVIGNKRYRQQRVSPTKGIGNKGYHLSKLIQVTIILELFLLSPSKIRQVYSWCTKLPSASITSHSHLHTSSRRFNESAIAPPASQQDLSADCNFNWVHNTAHILHLYSDVWDWYQLYKHFVSYLDVQLSNWQYFYYLLYKLLCDAKRCYDFILSSLCYDE